MEYMPLSADQVAAYEQKGYIIVKNFLSQAEVQKLHTIAVTDHVLQKHAFDLNDQAGKKQSLLYGTHRVMMPMVYSLRVNAW
ncbi:phytanoyl-CoA dioxygenase family protein [Niabella hibiscisoli]|uniref:phytanoyl-CoA dioxygenase family protein n=1 Tax=Niabella hibiscisoli TaxID=1825928 RepID=UPI001F0E34A0|nr:phytanoyl-CoA dioxygenase family protein [Niabella hibiscisoli]MCH5721307.1 phytanoyl-CoA dioxygenase family protein [Niabella hibiscisoli]